MKEPEAKKISLTKTHSRNTLEESAIARKENDHDGNQPQPSNGIHPTNGKKYLTKMRRGSHNEA
jgi:hypothetical protein